jgi:hypothetical protein
MGPRGTVDIIQSNLYGFPQLIPYTSLEKGKIISWLPLGTSGEIDAYKPRPLYIGTFDENLI